jgi:hypothetical protein
MNALKRRDVVQRIPLHGEVSTMRRVKSAFIVVVVTFLAIPSSMTTTLGPTPTSNPFALSSSCSALSFMKNIA